MPPKPTITIIGSGISGLALATGLLRRGIPIMMYEAAPSFSEIGLGLSLGPAAHRAMPLIDPAIRAIYDSLVTTHADSPGYEAFRETWFEFVWAGGERDGGLLMDLKALPSGQTAVRRADFLRELVGLIPEDIVSFGRRVVGVEEGKDGDGEGVRLVFQDGSVESADVVVGCDGIRSVVKEAMLGGEEGMVKPVYSGMYGYRAVLDMGDMVDAVGERRARVSTLYIGEGGKVNVGFYVLSPEWEGEGWVRPAKREDMERDAKGMGRLVQALVGRMPDASQWAIFEHPHISTYTRSRIAIMGDAAHASTPHQGAGAGQAIEDAHVLAELLGDSRVNSVPDIMAAFRAYDEIRRPRSQRVVTTSKENAYLFSLCFDGVGDDAEKLKEILKERSRWLWDLDVEDQVERARERMTAYLPAR
ncbi:uncharacterized protein N7511_008165 [Penicillium nucicola]|uniref:uncharacterized protein n=1 Tax=Penicillium nucicola TaxID=1850975 RepID=UPI002545775B|nr:uncharacterized protein N7511_008165 [Penicillium nucicola]KAJ5754012.1 hypothetical protein N7511_008165 [Penicillium nucicola]